MWETFSIEALNKQLISARLWRSWGASPSTQWCSTLALTGKLTPKSGCLLLPLSAVSTLSSLRVKWKVMESVCVNLAFSHSARSRLSSSSALILIIPVKLQTAPCTLLRCCCTPTVPLSLTGQTGSSAFIYPAQREACPAGQILFSSADSPTS